MKIEKMVMHSIQIVGFPSVQDKDMEMNSGEDQIVHVSTFSFGTSFSASPFSISYLTSLFCGFSIFSCLFLLWFVYLHLFFLVAGLYRGADLLLSLCCRAILKAQFNLTTLAHVYAPVELQNA